MSESLQHQFAQAMAEFEKQRESLVKAREEIAAVSVTARSRDRAVEVTLGSDGSPSGLRFLGNKHQTMSGKALAASVLEAMARAREELTTQVRARFDEVVGGGIGVAGGGAEALDKLDGAGLEKLMGPLKAPGGLLDPERGATVVDSNLFAALPDNIKQGGSLTDQFATLVRKIVSGYSGYYIDPNNPQIGEPDDDTVKAILKVYAPAYNQNVLALGQLADAIVSASDLTTKSGVNFETTQQDAIDHINSTNSRK